MGNPIVSTEVLQSIHHLEDVVAAGAFTRGPDQTAGLPHTITATSGVTSTATAGTIVSTTGLTGDYEDYVGLIFEALDGNCQGQLLLCTAFNPATDTATTTPLWKTSGITTTQFRIWKPPWPIVCCTAAGSTTVHTTAERDEADDYWIGHYLLWLNGDNAGEMQQISDSASGAQTITTAAFTNASADGDLGLIVNPLMIRGASIGLPPGTAIERGVVLDTLEQEGIKLGSQEAPTVTLEPEIRGLAAAAGDGTAAAAPAELHSILSSLFTETLDTGDAIDNGTTTSDTDTAICAEAAGTVSQWSLVLINGEVSAVESVTDNTPVGDTTVELVHTLSSGPATGDVVYAGANYKPGDTGHTTASFVAWVGISPQKMQAVWGGLPEVTAAIEGDGLGHYSMNYMLQAGFECDRVAGHSDVYDTGIPVVGKANVNRIVLDGTELLADVLSCNFRLLSAPQMKQAAFGAFENKGGAWYSSRDAGVSLVIQMEDTSYRHRYRALDEFDLLIQVGSVATQAWACWASRTQIVEIEESEADGILQWTLNCRFLRSTTSGKPQYVFAHF